MIFIFGGAYQVKTDFAKEKYNLSNSDVHFFGDETEFTVPKKCLNGYHLIVLSQLRAGIDPLKHLADNIYLLKYKIIICDDISSGIVPMGEENRKWREAAGRCAGLLSRNANEVWRVFCGIGTKIK